jgi:hypothetical protein
MYVDSNTIDSSGYLAGKTVGGMTSIMADTRVTNTIDSLHEVDSSYIYIQGNRTGVNTLQGVQLMASQYHTWGYGNYICKNVDKTGKASTLSIASGIHYYTSCTAVAPPVVITPPPVTVPVWDTTNIGSMNVKTVLKIDSNGITKSYILKL